MEKLRFGIVGTGIIAANFARAIKNIDCAELTAVASRSGGKADAFGDRFGIPRRFASYEEMALSDDIDAAYIALPHTLHAPVSIMMMKNGKHVLCEKPIAVNGRQAREMFDCAAQNNVFLMEAMWTRFHPSTVRLMELTQSGAIGDILGIEAKFCSRAEYDPASRLFDYNLGGGSTLDLGVYPVAFASWFLGGEIDDIAAQATFKNRIDTHLCALIKYKNGAIADVSSALSVRKPEDAYIYGTKGYVHIDRFYFADGFDVFADGAPAYRVDAPYFGNGYEEEIIHTCDCVGRGLTQSPVMTPASTLLVTDTLDRIRGLIGLKYPQD